jgi:predicted CXXCH cytochrome family protein
VLPDRTARDGGIDFRAAVRIVHVHALRRISGDYGAAMIPAGSMARALLGATLLVGAVVLGCAASSRERLEHFFFDVPSDVDRAAGSTGTEASVPQRQAVRVAGRTFQSVHPPFAERACDVCHDPRRQMRPREDLADECESCHDRYFTEAAAHFPVAEGDCAVCHDMHRSRYAALLRNPVNAICTDCHGEIEDLSVEAHGAHAKSSCTLCHDPHFGSGMFLKPNHPGS